MPKQKKQIEKLDTRQYKATELPGRKDSIYTLKDSREVKIEELAEKLNEIIDFINPLPSKEDKKKN